MTVVGGAATANTRHRLMEFAKTAMFKIFLFPYAAVCELYCGKVTDEDKFDDALIGYYIGIDVESSGVSQVREAWESCRKAYTSRFLVLDPCTENTEPHLEDKANTMDVVCCMQHLQMCFESEERAMILLRNVASMLKPGGYFFGITPTRPQYGMEPFYIIALSGETFWFSFTAYYFTEIRLPITTRIDQTMPLEDPPGACFHASHLAVLTRLSTIRHEKISRRRLKNRTKHTNKGHGEY